MEEAISAKKDFWCRRSVRIVFAAPLAVLVVGVVISVAVFLFVTRPVVDKGTSTPTADPDRPLMVAIGDSFIAGEGTEAYLAGTAVNRVNTCHRSNYAYPYLVARQLNYRLLAIACSGATTGNITEVAQHPHSPVGVFGAKPQIDYLQGEEGLFEDPSEIDLVVLSIGGNDVNFNDIVTGCLEGNCIPRTRDWMRDVDALQPELVATYRAIGDVTPDARKIVMPYPDLIAPFPCQVGFSNAEVQWVREHLLPRLNENIRLAASNAGWETADGVNAFVGARLCEPGVALRRQAVNRFKFDQLTAGGSPIGELTRGSFHPNQLGHTLLAAVLRAHLAIPEPDLEPCQEGRCPPPILPPDTSMLPPSPPDGPQVLYPMPESAPCVGGGYMDQEVRVIVDERTQTLHAAAWSQYCWREAGRGWHSAYADGDGEIRLDTARLADQRALSLEVLTQPDGHEWVRTVINATPSIERADPDKFSMRWEIAVVGAVLAVGCLLIAILPWVVCWFRRHRAVMRT